MKYKNIKTGVVLETASKLIGRDWVAVDELKKEEQETTEEYVEEDVDLTKLNKDELIELAKEQEVEINPRDKKDVIVETILKALS